MTLCLRRCWLSRARSGPMAALPTGTAAKNVISDGSVIAVADGQCVLIVEQGKVVDLCAEPGEYTYSTGTQPPCSAAG